MKDSAGKRILIIVENLPVPLDRRVWQEACALRDMGHQVTVICPQMRGFTQAEEVLDGITIYRHWISGEEAGVVGFLREYATALIGEFRCAYKAWVRGGFDIIHICNPPDILFLAALPYKLLHGVRIVFDVHDLWPEFYEAKFRRRGIFYWAVRLAERLTVACSDAVIATNESVRAAIIRRGKIAEDRTFVVRTSPSEVDTEARPDEALKRGRQFLVGYIGVMGDADGVDYLIRAAAHLVHRLGRRDIQFLIMGTGPEYENLVALRDELDLQAFVDLPGRVSNADLFSALQTIDAGVACDPINEYNNHCTMNKVLEYMAFGKPQVMFETVEGRVSAGEAAVYVGENSAEKLGEAIGALLDDPDRRRELGEIASRRLSGELGWDKSVDTLADAYDSLIAGPPLPPPFKNTVDTEVDWAAPGAEGDACDLTRRHRVEGGEIDDRGSVDGAVDSAEILGSRIRFPRSCRQAYEAILRRALEGGGTYVTINNVHTIVEGVMDRSYRDITNAAFLALPDGKPLSILARLKGIRGAIRIFGPTFLEFAMDAGRKDGVNHFFLGSTPEVLADIREQCAALFPGANIVGMISPPFRALSPDEESAFLDEIRQSGADFIWVGLGAPRQERWIAKHAGRLDRGVMLGVGAGFDYLAGNLKHAPAWMKDYSLEWLFRLCQEPRRLWKRYLVTNSVFLFCLLLEASGLKRFPASPLSAAHRTLDLGANKL
ncbi:MAG: WecB/TagA/CpsF family glycosyltransferase [Verrucomicrobiales bacterium]